jgi:hypothetical protein
MQFLLAEAIFYIFWLGAFNSKQEMTGCPPIIWHGELKKNLLLNSSINYMAVNILNLIISLL